MKVALSAKPELQSLGLNVRFGLTAILWTKNAVGCKGPQSRHPDPHLSGRGYPLWKKALTAMEFHSEAAVISGGLTQVYSAFVGPSVLLGARVRTRQEQTVTISFQGAHFPKEVILYTDFFYLDTACHIGIWEKLRRNVVLNWITRR